MAASKKSSPAGPDQAEPLFRYRNKAEWLMDQFWPDNPTFPLDPCLLDYMPTELPGRMPRTAMEFDRALTARPRRRSARRRSRNARGRSPATDERGRWNGGQE